MNPTTITEKWTNPVFRVYLTKRTDQCDYNLCAITFQFTQDSFVKFGEQQKIECDMDYPIRVLKINKDDPECGAEEAAADSVMQCYTLKHRGYLLRHINIGGEIYEPAAGMEFWVPLVPRPRNMRDGCIQLYNKDRSQDNCASVLVNMQHNSIPFMDLSGTFHYKGRISSMLTDNNECVKCNREATIFSAGNKITAYLDHETHKLHSVQDEVAFYEMERVVSYNPK
jgi:hypothetical protein